MNEKPNCLLNGHGYDNSDICIYCKKPKPSPKELLAEVMQIVESDLMKAHHYLDKAMQVAMHSGDMKAAYDIAPISVGVAMYIKQTSHTLKQMKEALNDGR